MLKRKLQKEFLSQVPPINALNEPYNPEEHDDVRGPSGTIYRDTSIFCLTPWHEPRRSAILLIESKPFDAQRCARENRDEQCMVKLRKVP